MFSLKTKFHIPFNTPMKRFLALLLFISLLSCGGDDPQPVDPTTPIVDPNTPVGSGNNDVLVWSEEFDYEGEPDSSIWRIETGNGDWGWGNGEVQYYQKSNFQVSDGTLKITAKKEKKGNFDYTSGRMKTQGNYSFKYGKMEVKAKLPASQGTWPAIWLLGNTHSSLGWPFCGEIDVMEQRGNEKSYVLGTTHWNNGSTYSPASYSKDSNDVVNLDSEWHIYTMDWTENYIKISVDDDDYYRINLNDNLPFYSPFFIIVNVAMGGTLGGSIDPNFTEDFMEIDYIRVYQ